MWCWELCNWLYFYRRVLRESRLDGCELCFLFLLWMYCCTCRRHRSDSFHCCAQHKPVFVYYTNLFWVYSCMTHRCYRLCCFLHSNPPKITETVTCFLVGRYPSRFCLNFRQTICCGHKHFVHKLLIGFQVLLVFHLKVLTSNHKILWEQPCCFSTSTQTNTNKSDCQEESSKGYFRNKGEKVV